MATLTRSRTEPLDDQLSVLASTIPAPFSAEERANVLRLQAERDAANLASPNAYSFERTDRFPGDAILIEVNDDQEERQGHTATERTQDVMPSIANVQISVLTTLSDLLNVAKPLRPTLADRRHSLPARASTSRPLPLEVLTSQAALQTLVAGLRDQASGSEMVETRSLSNDAELLQELQTHVEYQLHTLDADDAELAMTLVSLLAHLNRLSTIGVSPATTPKPTQTWTHGDRPVSDNVFDTLSRQLQDFQQRRQTQPESNQDALTPVLAVEKALLWNRVDENLDTVLRLCRQRRADDHTRVDNLPQYDAAGYEFDGPPGYELHSAAGDMKAAAASSSVSLVRSTSAASEKMRLDLNAVTMAIDRLYRVAPQLHNQRVELKSAKLEELERARLSAESSEVVEGKRKERELEFIVEMIGKASDRKYSDQTVTLEGGMNARVERARQRDIARRQEFVDKLVEHSAAGRMHAQDASFPSVKPKDPNAMLTLPEFIRESVPKSLQPPPDPHALLTLTEAIREAEPQMLIAAPKPLVRTKSGKGLRSRSMSAPALNWLMATGSRPSLEGRGTRSQRSSRPSSSSGRKSVTVPTELQVFYVAEHHENLRHVLAFLSVTGMTAGVNLEANVHPSTSGSSDPSLVLRSGSIESPALPLPVQVASGPQDIRVQGMHYEIKLSAADAVPAPEPVPLLDAAQLLAASPTTYICASCSLPLVQSARITRYDDLPSEHWAELVDAWMCHADQKLSAQVSRHGQGFWPEVGQALVGGSYILFDGSAVVKSNLWVADQPKHGEEWCTVRCICGTFSGRCQDHVNAAGEKTAVYRLVKYAIRPVSPSTEPSRIPLSAFIVEDMVELARAHATYRFVIMDEEEERPRLLIWLFKPSMRLSYNAQSHYLLPKRGVILAAKVLYKILGPSTVYTDLPSLMDRYPGFPQAEQLMYPKDTCTSLAALLSESNKCYPESMRSMTGLEVGWLLRA
ncbi:hypothetical protein BV25DRAFT_299244 [Artomyces pyxidatus]|uniref:Uncharacterized protein n=1 Tax=Artomyces pyxidatus TaxID=48021 RepID=A0ACB8T8J8_9AGAM|nr:hypothetical protein BV25DRAFT_299244 [Artomyces pyxidatus]